MSGADWLRLVALATLWGGSFFFVEVALEDMPPLTLVLVRLGLAALVLHMVVLARGLRMPCDPRMWRSFAILGLFGNAIPFSLIFWGQTEITGSLASIINATTPIWTVLLGHVIVSGERLTLRRAMGVTLGFSGVVVMIGMSALSGLGGAVLAQCACVLATVSFAFAPHYGRRFKDIPPLVTATGQLTMSASIMLPVALVVDAPWTLELPGAMPAAATLALALASTSLAFLLYFRVLASAGAVNVMLVTFLIPVSAILLGTLILGEVLLSRHIAGMALIGLGLAIIDGRAWHWLMGRARAAQGRPRA